MQEREAELKLQKAQELGKAELAAAIANEKAAQIEKLAEANLNVSYPLVDNFIKKNTTETNISTV